MFVCTNCVVYCGTGNLIYILEKYPFLHKFKPQSFNVKHLVMHDNAPSHISKFTQEFFEHKRFTGKKLMEWPQSSLDLNLIENL